jgi:hypothetical protein
MPAHERLRTPLGQARAAGRAVSALLVTAFGAVRRGLGLAATACASADRWLAARLPDAAPGWAATGVWAGIQRAGRGCPTADLCFLNASTSPVTFSAARVSAQ